MKSVVEREERREPDGQRDRELWQRERETELVIEKDSLRLREKESERQRQRHSGE